VPNFGTERFVDRIHYQICHGLDHTTS